MSTNSEDSQAWDLSLMLTSKMYNSDANYQSNADALCLRVGREKGVQTGGVKDACIPP